MQQPGLKVAYSSEPESVVTLTGELDLATAPALRESFLRLLNGAEEDPADLVVDMSGVSFVDSSGVAVLLMGARRWASHDRRLVLRGASAQVRRVLELTGAVRAFELEP